MNTNKILDDVCFRYDLVLAIGLLVCNERRYGTLALFYKELFRAAIYYKAELRNQTEIGQEEQFGRQIVQRQVAIHSNLFESRG